MSYPSADRPDPLVTVRRATDASLLVMSPTTSMRFVAPGSTTAGRFGLFEIRLAAKAPGARYFEELAEIVASSRRPTSEEMADLYARHDQVNLPEEPRGVDGRR